METSLLIPKVVEEITKDIGYCGSCMGGCSPMVRFICIGLNGDAINKWVEEHPDKIAKWESEMDI